MDLGWTFGNRAPVTRRDTRLKEGRHFQDDPRAGRRSSHVHPIALCRCPVQMLHAALARAPSGPSTNEMCSGIAVSDMIRERQRRERAGLVQAGKTHQVPGAINTDRQGPEHVILLLACLAGARLVDLIHG